MVGVYLRLPYACHASSNTQYLDLYCLNHKLPAGSGKEDGSKLCAVPNPFTIATLKPKPRKRRCAAVWNPTHSPSPRRYVAQALKGEKKMEGKREKKPARRTTSNLDWSIGSVHSRSRPGCCASMEAECKAIRGTCPTTPQSPAAGRPRTPREDDLASRQEVKCRLSPAAASHLSWSAVGFREADACSAENDEDDWIGFQPDHVQYRAANRT